MLHPDLAEHDDARVVARLEAEKRQQIAGIERRAVKEVPRTYAGDPRPGKGRNLKRAIGVSARLEFPPLKQRVFGAIAAYADGGVHDPSLRMIAARAKVTKPVAMFLIRDLERRGLIEVVWALGEDEPNVYKIIWLDD